MTIQIKHIAVITRRFSLESNYPGGINQLIFDSPCDAISQDNFLIAVHFHSELSARKFIRKLTRQHLIYSPDGHYSDILLLNYSDTRRQHCDWLVVNNQLDNTLFCHSALEQAKQISGLEL
ncbi:hypothetical protein SIN8267_01637 [Sinobacterium norvegicum]|uniref:Uncharacterized protein n=1 Tax=Sinobacterium norvegicum TaxID=1641715 RepID=A0ABN8EGX1_9GAMM|nr:hypothetical protein [Sinobacterium norvegicum]CAH0991531.1 hypothetical protein SIN8267_01637 [Sinobacterium norvegicum]